MVKIAKENKEENKGKKDLEKTHQALTSISTSLEKTKKTKARSYLLKNVLPFRFEC